mgnify:CR=1 FL=1
MEQRPPRGLKKIPTSRFARARKLSGLTARLGAAALGEKFASAFKNKVVAAADKRLHHVNQARKIVAELSRMKGAAMKLGQMVSLHGEHFFPKEVVEILSTLQGESQFMEWPAMERVIASELGADFRKRLLDFSKQPIAAASIGQVHRACLEDGTQVAVKVQYPGVDLSIDSDVDALGTIFKIAAQVPQSGDFQSVLDEVKEVLLQETDYLREGAAMDEFRGYFADVPPVVIPRYFPEHSTKRILTTEFMRGVHPREFGESSAAEGTRNSIGLSFLHVFYKELFRFGVIQTDPNFANYLIDAEARRLVLLDFGAVKCFDDQWRRLYIEMIGASFQRNRKRCIEAGIELGLIRGDDPPSVKDLHVELCDMFLEPFHASGAYDFRASDLPLRMKAMVPRIFKELGLRAPPRQLIFLNRKMVGVYYFMSTIRARIDVRPLLEQYLPR